jgi:predicted MPP superfamily phosphohydrolase
VNLPTSARSNLTRALLRPLLVLGLVLLTAAALSLFGIKPPHNRVRMSRGEIFVILVFFGVAGAMAIASLLSLISLLRMILARQWHRDRVRTVTTVIYAALGLGLVGAVLYARFIEPMHLTVHRETIPLADLAAPLRVVLFSDVHTDPRFPIDDRLVEVIGQEHPDLLLFIGDSINTASGARRFRDTLARLQAPVKLAIRGNWDVWYWDDIDLFGGTGFTELSSGWRQLKVRGIPLRVGAHAYVDAWSPEKVVPAPPPGPGPTIFLYHATDYAHVAAQRGIDLYLNGDTHGGQVALPFYGPLLSIGRRGREFSRGLYQVGKTAVIVTPGIGVERSFPLRFLVPPEVTVLDLVPAVSRESW